MDSSKTNEINNIINGEDKSAHSFYYGVYTPNDNTNGKANVFQDKTEALKLAKRNKKSRFKAFQFYHEAAEFSLNGLECPNNNTTVEGPLFQKKTIEPVQQPLGEKASPFKGPKPQDFIELRKEIEIGNVGFVRVAIWTNPRYLVSSGDTPSILQEGPRYNALHVAAKARSAAITEVILNAITDPEFIKLLYGDDNHENAEDRCHMLLDLYLNTPNKGINETPLHFAAKYGAADVVEILVSYPQCNKRKRNKHYKTADEIVCERYEGRDFNQVAKKIDLLLEDNYYVPVLRTEDNSLPPLIGEPFSPTSPPVLNKHPMSPRLEIHAYAGPMDKKGAHQFRKVWKTPPRSHNFNSPNGTKQPPDDLISMSALRFKDPQKGLERIGKKLANKFEVPWKEYWQFLDNFVDIASEEGLNILENYLSNRYASLNESLVSEFKIDSTRKTDILSPITNLCAAFTACHLNDSQDQSVDQKSDFDPLVYIDKACQVFANRISNNILYILCSNCENISKVLESEIKQLELLLNSYMDDNRFNTINFQKVHSRLGTLIGQRLENNIKADVDAHFLCGKIENVLEGITKSLDCFSSDDESHNLKEIIVEQKKPTVHRKQLVCLIHYVLNVLAHKYENNRLEENNCVSEWENTEACSCVYHFRKSKKNSLSRSSSFKNHFKFVGRGDAEGISRKLFSDDNDNPNGAVNDGLSVNSVSVNSKDDSGSASEDEAFYTPPSSPSILVESDSENEFDDTELPKQYVFLEGDCPTKTDCAVFDAIKYAGVRLCDKKHPNIYRWHHNISLYSDAERQSWLSLRQVENAKKPITESPNTSLSSSSCFQSSNVSSPSTSTPSKSWLRVTGTNSPRAVFKSYSMNV